MRGDPSAEAGRSARAEGARRNRRHHHLVLLAAVGAGAAGAVAAAASGAGGVTAAALGVAAAAAVVVVAAMVAGDQGRWERGSVGEAATAGLLEGLPARRWVVLHDRGVPGSRANVDHVAFGPTGVWVVDSKAYRARLRAGWRSVRAGDRRIDTSPAAWEAERVSHALGGVPVRAVLAVHGVGLRRRGRTVGGVPVLPAEAVVARLCRRRGSAHLRRREVADLAACLDAAWAPALRR